MSDTYHWLAKNYPAPNLRERIEKLRRKHDQLTAELETLRVWVSTIVDAADIGDPITDAHIEGGRALLDGKPVRVKINVLPELISNLIGYIRAYLNKPCSLTLSRLESAIGRTYDYLDGKPVTNWQELAGRLAKELRLWFDDYGWDSDTIELLDEREKAGLEVPE